MGQKVLTTSINITLKIHEVLNEEKARNIANMDFFTI